MNPERMTTPARKLGADDVQAELRRLDHGYLVPNERLRVDALELRWRELAGEAVDWPMLTDCGWCYGSGFDTDGACCADCDGRGKLAVVLTDRCEIVLQVGA